MRCLPRFHLFDVLNTPEDLFKTWCRDGVLVIEDVIPAYEGDELRTSSDRLVECFDPNENQTIFSTSSHEHVASKYFETSGDKVRFFFEENVFDNKGKLIRPKNLSINKIGHAIHDLIPEFREFSYHPRLADLANRLGLADALVIQSMLIFKQPGIGGEVIWHQDGTFLYTEPESVTGFWFALEDADCQNGCLWVIPGGHKEGLRQRFQRIDGTLQLRDVDEQKPLDLRRKLPIEVTKGSLVVIHGRLPHYSAVNQSNRSRQAYSLHTISASARYPSDNWLQRGPDMPLRYLHNRGL